jgi:hypothetical protein
MASTALVVFDEARTMLHDVLATKYTNGALTPFLRKAYRSYQMKMNRAGLEITEEVSAALTVTAGTVSLGDGSGLPLDFFLPLDLRERRVGGSENDWKGIDEGGWDIVRTPRETLDIWTWREEQIKFCGATSDREVLIHYVKNLAAISDQSSPIQIVSAEGFLASKTAAYAAIFIGENPARAAVCDSSAAEEWDDFFAARINSKQDRPVRRRVNRYRR